MGAQNTERISHKLEGLPSTFRDDQLRQIIDDLNEEDSGKGFGEVTYVGATPFIQKITTWNSSAKTKKRTEVTFTYSPSPFLSQIVKQFFDEEFGTTVIATTTVTIAYNTNKTVKEIDVVNTRP